MYRDLGYSKGELCAVVCQACVVRDGRFCNAVRAELCAVVSPVVVAANCALQFIRHVSSASDPGLDRAAFVFGAGDNP